MGKKIILSLLFIGSSSGAWADLTIELTPGSASAHAYEISQASGTLKVKGAVDARDFETLNSLPESVTCLDMSGMKVEARSTALPDAMGFRFHAADLIPPYAFFRCPTREVVFPSGCSLGEGVMANALTQTVTLPEDLLEIPSYAFYGSGVESLSSLSGVLRVGAYSFFGSKVDRLSLPALRQGGDYALASMPELTEVTLNPVARLGTGFLMGCPVLTEVTGAPVHMPDYFAADSRRLDAERLVAGSEEVGGYAVANMRNTAVVLAAGLKRIGEGAFAGMTRLSMIEANACGADVPEASETAFYGVDPSAVSLYVASGSASAWRSDPVWGLFNVVEGPSSVGSLADADSGIGFRFDGRILSVSSATPLRALDVYDMAGRVLLHLSPDSCGFSLDLPAGTDASVVLVKAANEREASSVRLLLR